MNEVGRTSSLLGTDPSTRGPGRETLSVILTAWQRRRFLPQALRSIQTSSKLDLELCVVADFLDEGMEHEVRDMHGKWIVSHNRYLGGMVAEGLMHSRGSLIAFLDDDDLFHPSRLDEVGRAFEGDPDLGFYHNSQITFRDGDVPQFSIPLPTGKQTRIPPGRRLQSDCESIWTEGAGYNGSSTVVRRTLLESRSDELSRIRRALPPYLFYRAWCSPFALMMDSRHLTAVRHHEANMTPSRIQSRRARLARLASIGNDLSADSETILGMVPGHVWSIPLRQMVSMGEILAALGDGSESSQMLPAAILEVLRRRRIWLPRWTLLCLALTRMGSRRGSRALFIWLTR